MPKLAIISASSQVGSSVALYLHLFNKADLVAFSRTFYPAPFYDALNIPHRILPSDSSALRRELEQFDVVVDFSIPHAEFWENKAIMDAHLAGLIDNLHPEIVFISMSSQNAFGFRDSDIFIRHRFTNWANPYCSLKRDGEKLVNRLGRKRGVRVFNLRLGQVHGCLQSVSHRFCEDISSLKSLIVAGLSTDRTNTLFISDLGEAILQIASGQVRQGTYSVLSTPQWDQKQLYEYYQNWSGATCDVVFNGHGIYPTLTAWSTSHVIRVIERHRGFIDVAILQRLSGVAARAKGIHRVRFCRRKQPVRQPNGVHQNLLGTPPLTVLGDHRGSPKSMLERERLMEEAWFKALESTVQYSPDLEKCL